MLLLTAFRRQYVLIIKLTNGGGRGMIMSNTRTKRGNMTGGFAWGSTPDTTNDATATQSVGMYCGFLNTLLKGEEINSHRDGGIFIRFLCHFNQGQNTTQASLQS